MQSNLDVAAVQEHDQAADESPQQTKIERLHRTGLAACDGVVEQIYDPTTCESRFAVRIAGEATTRLLHYVPLSGLQRLYPLNDTLIHKGRLLLPETPAPYGSTAQLAEEIRAHLVLYLRLPSGVEGIVAHYILFTWLADRFPTTPYLRFIGDLGTGKSRALEVVGDICYKPFRGGGTASPAALFRALERYGPCTLVLDELDLFARNEQHQEIMNMLRTGFQQRIGVLRCEKEGDEFVVRDYAVFGPKVLAGRSNFPDSALESRCIRVYMQPSVDLGTIPTELPDDYAARAAQLRNKLLAWRLDYYFKTLTAPPLPQIEPRLQQVFGPLASVMNDPGESAEDSVALANLTETMLELQGDLTESRRESAEGRVLAALVGMAEAPTHRLYLKTIATLAQAGDYPLHPKRVATICRGFGLSVAKDREGRFVTFSPTEHESLLRKYGLWPVAKAA